MLCAAARFHSLHFINVLLIIHNDFRWQNFCEAGNLQRGHLGFAYFNNHSFHVLDVLAIENKQVFDSLQCLLGCVRNPDCFSINLAVNRNESGRFTCKLLPSDKYNLSLSFKPSQFYHHFSLLLRHNLTC